MLAVYNQRVCFKNKSQCQKLPSMHSHCLKLLNHRIRYLWYVFIVPLGLHSEHVTTSIIKEEWLVEVRLYFFICSKSVPWCFVPYKEMDFSNLSIWKKHNTTIPFLHPCVFLTEKNLALFDNSQDFAAVRTTFTRDVFHYMCW